MIAKNDYVVVRNSGLYGIAANDEQLNNVLVDIGGTSTSYPTALVEPLAFDFTVYSRRWKHNDAYSLKMIKAGWHVDHIAISGPCDQHGQPFLYENLDQDNIKYPSSLGIQIGDLWAAAVSQNLPQSQVSSLLEAIARTIRKMNGGV